MRGKLPRQVVLRPATQSHESNLNGPECFPGQVLMCEDIGQMRRAVELDREVASSVMVL